MHGILFLVVVVVATTTATNVVLNNTNTSSQVVLFASQPIGQWNLLNHGVADSTNWVAFEWLEIDAVDTSTIPAQTTVHTLLGSSASSSSYASYAPTPGTWTGASDGSYRLSMTLDNGAQVTVSSLFVCNASSRTPKLVDNGLLALDRNGSVLWGIEVGSWPGAASTLQLVVKLRIVYGGGGPFPKPSYALQYPLQALEEFQVGWATVDVPEIVGIDDTSFYTMATVPTISTIAEDAAQIDLVLSFPSTSFTTEADLDVLFKFGNNSALGRVAATWTVLLLLLLLATIVAL